jgi:Fur family zinc uptake transcriptional regulator
MAQSDFPSPDHDHRACVEISMARARAAFEARGARLTELREALLRTLAENHEALGAYDIIERLRARGRDVAPISVYRILDMLLQTGLVHRIESRNAFVACHGSHDADGAPVLFLVCEKCGNVAESPDGKLAEELAERAGRVGFRPHGSVLEVSGLCRHCAG